MRLLFSRQLQKLNPSADYSIAVTHVGEMGERMKDETPSQKSKGRKEHRA
ncbi:hypothetical protein JOD20_004900 [Herpetosiphon giganteus]|nr:hypothetical protein [Herpetosiphon giganteus]